MEPESGVEFGEQVLGHATDLAADPVEGDGPDLLGLGLGVVPEPGRGGGFGGALVLRGGAGVGKTALVAHAVAAASGFLVSAIAGVESEIKLDYGAAHQLLISFLPLAKSGPHRLPAPARPT
jgi:hypothetical protein